MRTANNRAGRCTTLLGALVTAIMLVCAIAAPAAMAEFEIGHFDGSIANRDGSTDIQAGSHPYALTTVIGMHTHLDPVTGLVTPDENPRDIEVTLPAGLVGNPQATPRCTLGQLSNLACPDDTAIGTIDLALVGVGQTGELPVYNVTPPPGVPGRFAFVLISAVVTIDAHVQTGGGYPVSVTISNMPQTVTMETSTLTLWGVPADPGHDEERGACAPNLFNEFATGSCPTDAEPEPFLTLPSNCSAGPMEFRARVDSWLHPGVWHSTSYVSHLGDGTPFGVDGCTELGFAPRILVATQSHAADSPSGLSVDLRVPQNEAASGYATANLKRSVTVLPEGVRINPAAANGLTGCSEAEIALHDSAPPSCPDSSKIGTVEIVSPMLPDPLVGAAYQARQHDNPFGSNLAFYTYSEADGVAIKLAAEVRTDPRTGQVTTTFDGNPQLGFSDFKLNFDGGPSAPLLMPPACGTFTATQEATPWSATDPDHPSAAETVSSSSSFAITGGPNGSPCPGGALEPEFAAGSSSLLAGGFSPFVLRLARADGTQQLAAMQATLPAGLLGKLAGIPYCPEAGIAAAAAVSGAGEEASPSCPAASQIGTVRVAAGGGPRPLHQSGRVYLAGPYEGAPLSLVVVTPAIAGPLDLGTTVVRAALLVDPTTAQVTVKADAIPHALVVSGDGFPLDLRSVAVSIDRPQFIRNPTSCEESAVSGVVGGLEGATAQVAQRFRVAGCGGLGFRPGLSLRLSGQTRRAGHPALRATLRMPSSATGADVSRVEVSLPHSEFLAQSHLRNVCTRARYAEGAGGGAGCPRSTIYGHAVAYSPLLDRPLRGPVFLRANGGERELPDLVASLGGQIHVDLVGHIDSDRRTGGMRTTFAAVPDAPVSRFVLSMPGGAKGLLENSTDICRGSHRATVRMRAHNGRRARFSPELKADCGGKTRPPGRG